MVNISGADDDDDDDVPFSSIITHHIKQMNKLKKNYHQMKITKFSLSFLVVLSFVFVDNKNHCIPHTHCIYFSVVLYDILTMIEYILSSIIIIINFKLNKISLNK